MAEITVKTVKLSAIRLNPDNPRRISEKGMDRLVKSLQDFPEMMELREIVVDETMTVLGGNMRTLALRKIGVKECVAKIVTGLTHDQKREFIVKDNGAFGEWDFDLLANGFDDLPLADFGIDLPGDWLKPIGEVEPPGLRDGDREPFRQMTFTVHDEQFEEIEAALKKAKQAGGAESAVNENSNGNALTFICMEFNRG